jgi:hypothetical protein
MNTTYRPNRYSGSCSSCHRDVGSHEGIYVDGRVLCGPEIWDAQVYEIDGIEVLVSAVGCETSRLQSAHEKARYAREAANHTPQPLTPEEAARAAALDAKWASEDAAWAKQGLCRCDRCGGVGGHNSWPGFTCFKCNGAGAVLDVEAGQ